MVKVSRLVVMKSSQAIVEAGDLRWGKAEEINCAAGDGEGDAYDPEEGAHGETRVQASMGTP